MCVCVCVCVERGGVSEWGNEFVNEWLDGGFSGWLIVCVCVFLCVGGEWVNFGTNLWMIVWVGELLAGWFCVCVGVGVCVCVFGGGPEWMRERICGWVVGSEG